jgi:hypothetical protein
MNKQISLLDSTPLPFELYLLKHQAYMAPSNSENQKAAEYFKPRLMKKG